MARLPQAGSRTILPEAKERYDKDNEAEMRRLVENALDRTGSGGGLPSRRNVVFTSASLVAGASSTASANFGAPAQVLLIISVDRACRLRFYALASAQANDSARAYTTPPQAGLGILLDAIWLTAHTKHVAPPVILYSGDNPAASTIYYTVQNLSGTTGTATVTATVVSIEA